MNRSILVAGSTNTDMVVRAARLPSPGETVLGGEFLMNGGGKGANQAVAAARLGGRVTFLSCVGDDLFGAQSMDSFRKEGIDCGAIKVDKAHPSGTALITVDSKGENCIVVAPGANSCLLPADVLAAENAILSAEMVLVQLEIPLETVVALVELAAAGGKKVILNPAPAQVLPDELIHKLYVLTPNEKEAGLLSGIPVTNEATAIQAAAVLGGKGVPVVIITLGGQGALVWKEGVARMVAAPKVSAVDTTAAGDVFNGALAVALAEGMDLEEAVSFACRAGALSVTRVGAQASAPRREEVEGMTGE